MRLLADVGDGGDFPERSPRGGTNGADARVGLTCDINDRVVGSDVEAKTQGIDPRTTTCQQVSHQRKGVSFRVVTDAAAVDDAGGVQSKDPGSAARALVGAQDGVVPAGMGETASQQAHAAALEGLVERSRALRWQAVAMDFPPRGPRDAGSGRVR